MTIKPSYILFFCFLFLSAQWKESASIPAHVTGKWKLFILHSRDTKQFTNKSVVHIEIDPDGMTTGFTGCNKIRTNCSIAGEAIQFGTILSSRKFCEKEFMDLEDHMKDILKNATTYHLKNNQLTLYTGKKKLATFSKE